MHYAAQLSHPRSMLVPLVALAIGAGGAVGTYAVLDDTDVSVNPTRVIVADAPAQPSQGVAAKNEARTAAAISTSSLAGTSSFGKDEAASAAAVGTREPHVGGGPPAESRGHVPQQDTAISSDPLSKPRPGR